MVCPTRATIFSTKDLWLIETAAVRNRMPGGVGGTAVMSRLPTRLERYNMNFPKCREVRHKKSRTQNGFTDESLDRSPESLTTSSS